MSCGSTVVTLLIQANARIGLLRDRTACSQCFSLCFHVIACLFYFNKFFVTTSSTTLEVVCILLVNSDAGMYFFTCAKHW